MPLNCQLHPALAIPTGNGLEWLEQVRAWGGGRKDYPSAKSVAQVFEEVAAAHPLATAVIDGTGNMNYAELNARANRVAHALRSMGVGPEAMVGCCLERSAQLIIALLAILKAGGAYVPLDPGYPEDRVNLLLEDSGVPLVVTQRSLESVIPASPTRSLLFMEDVDTSAAGANLAGPMPAAGPSNLAYVMYTSGSTGRPKGVMIENRGIVRLVRNTNYCHFGPGETFLQFAPISFDASTFEIWGPLLNGSRLVMAPPGAISLDDLGKIIREQRVSTLWLTAGLFHLMVEQRLEDLQPVRQLLAGGDVLSSRHIRMALERLPHCTVINGYGPTENTTFTCCHVIRPGEMVPDSVPIGVPVSNTQVYILDEQLNPVKPGIPGELYTAGDGLARGYLTDSKATAEKFIRNPFAEHPDRRMYRTGDLAKWREDGQIEFIGRADDQVKVLGYRIEPGEVEAVLAKHPDIKQVCVVARTGANEGKRLVACYVPVAERAPSASELRDFVASKLPHYMIPAAFEAIESLPLSPNGKVDRKALCEGRSNAQSAQGSAAPAPNSNSAERILIELWGRILHVRNVGLDDNFFDLGGDSLLLVAVHSKLQVALQRKIEVTDLFEFTTVRKLAAHLSRKDESAAPLLAEARERAEKQRGAFARLRQLQFPGET